MIISAIDDETKERNPFVWFEGIVGYMRCWNSYSRNIAAFSFEMKDHIVSCLSEKLYMTVIDEIEMLKA